MYVYIYIYFLVQFQNRPVQSRYILDADRYILYVNHDIYYMSIDVCI